MNNLDTYEEDCKSADLFREQEKAAREANPERRANEEAFKGVSRWLDDKE